MPGRPSDLIRRQLAGGIGACIAVVLAAGGCGPHAEPTTAPPPGPTGHAATAVLVDADPYGAILLDRQGAYVGITRDGAVVWRESAGVRAYSLVSCLVRCPDAALSASLEASNAAAVADPVPRLVVGGRQRLLSAVSGPKRRILTAASAEDYVLAVGDPGQAWLELHRAGGAVARLRVAGFDSRLYRAAAGGQALVITAAAPGGNEARWLERTVRGWQPAGTTQRVTGAGACVAPDGSRALLIGQRPAVLDRAGNQRPVTDLDSAGACAWARSGGIVAELAMTPAGPRSRVRVFDAAGSVRSRLDTVGVAAVTADPTRARVAYLVDRVLHEIDAVTGTELRTTVGVQSAQYDTRGHLVTVADDDSVTWRLIDNR